MNFATGWCYLSKLDFSDLCRLFARSRIEGNFTAREAHGTDLDTNGLHGRT